MTDTPEERAVQIAERHGIQTIAVPDIIRAIRQAEAAAVAREREACAAMLERRAFTYCASTPIALTESKTGEKATHICAAAIRAREGE